MKKIIILLILAIFSCISIGLVFAEDVWVDPYVRKDGTYVPGHYRSKPNNSRIDNYSYPGNINPYTGEISPPSDNPKYTWPSNPNPYDNYEYGP